MMAKMRHPNTVLYLGFCPSPPVVVTEFCSRGSLLECLRQVGSCLSQNSGRCEAVVAEDPRGVYGMGVAFKHAMNTSAP